MSFIYSFNTGAEEELLWDRAQHGRGRFGPGDRRKKKGPFRKCRTGQMFDYFLVVGVRRGSAAMGAPASTAMRAAATAAV